MFNSPFWLSLFKQFDFCSFRYWTGAHTFVVLFTFLLWFSLYYLCKFACPYIYETYTTLNRDMRREWNSRIVSSIHALWQTIGSVLILTHMETWDFNSWSGLSEIYFSSLVGYMFYDACMCISTPHMRTFSYFFHHVFSITSVFAVVSHQCGCAPAAIFLSTEASTGFVNFRWFFDKSGMKNTGLAAINGILMWLVFGVARVFFSIPITIYLVYTYYQQILDHGGWILLISYGALFLTIATLNLMWYSAITKGMLKRVRKVFGKQQQQHHDKTN